MFLFLFKCLKTQNYAQKLHQKSLDVKTEVASKRLSLTLLTYLDLKLMYVLSVVIYESNIYLYIYKLPKYNIHAYLRTYGDRKKTHNCIWRPKFMFVATTK